MPDEVDLPKWYMMMEKAAGKLLVGFLSAETFTVTWVSKVFTPKAIEIIQGFLIPFGIVCMVLAGYKGLEKINTFLELIKKIKDNAK